MNGRKLSTFADGRDIAMKVPPAQWTATVAVYRDTLGPQELDDPFTSGPQSRSASPSGPTGCGPNAYRG